MYIKHLLIICISSQPACATSISADLHSIQLHYKHYLLVCTLDNCATNISPHLR